ncbi:DUF2281 domain-containing protein [Phormidesmis sp. 146-35]
MSTAETIYELVKTLPEEQARTVLKFAEFLRQETNQSTATSESELGWEAGFFEKTAGCLADDPIIRHPQPPYDVREPIA